MTIDTPGSRPAPDVDDGGVLTRLGFGSRGPTAPVVGLDARLKWWERLRAVVALAIIITALGIALAALIGAVVFLGGYGLEQVVSS